MLETCYQYERIEAGCDEAGRGCLAGAVFAAAVILPPDFHDPLLNDSKLMSERNATGSGRSSNARRWRGPSLPSRPNASTKSTSSTPRFEGMCRAVGELRTRPEFLAIDGNRFRSSLDIPYRCIVKGDGKYADIAAASVLAKTHRDEYMRRLAEEFPQYGWAKNKGYPTREHRLAVRRYGGDALSPADVQSRIGAAGTFLIGSAGGCAATLFYRISRNRTDRRSTWECGRCCFARLCCVAASARGAERTDAVAGEGAGSTAERQIGAHGPSTGRRLRVRSGTAFRRHTAAPCRGAISTGFEPLRSGQREFFRTMVRM